MHSIKLLLRIVFGFIFIASAILKLYPIEPFENLLVQYNISNYLLAPFIARGLISLEILIGLYFIFSAKIYQLVYKLVLAFLIVLTVFLFIQLAVEGNISNCGCFGEIISLTPLESVIKNFLLIAVLLFVRKTTLPTVIKVKWILPVLFLLIAAFTPYLLNPVGVFNIQAKELNEKIDLSGLPSLYKSDKKINFSKGKHLVVYLSTSCPHCKNTASRLSVLIKKYNYSNIVYIIGGDDNELYDEFVTYTKSEQVPIIRIIDNTFFKYSGGELPALVYIENGVLKKKWTGEFFDIEEVKTTLAK